MGREADLRRRGSRLRDVRHGRGREKSPRPLRDLDFMEYTVTPDAIDNPDPDNDAFTRYLGPDRHERLHGLVNTNPALAAGELEGLLIEYGPAPLLYNWLVAAYTRTGRGEKADEITRLNYERYPNYLFARLNYAHMLLSDGKVEEVARVMDDKFDLKLLYPWRDTFHITEFTAMATLAIGYYLRGDRPEPAMRIFRILKKLAPDSEATFTCARLIAASRMSRTFASLMERARQRDLQWQSGRGEAGE